VAGALAAVAAATGLGLTRLEVDTAIGSLLPTGDAAVTQWEQTQASFGADPVVVLVETDTPGALLNPDSVKRMVALESTLAALPNVAVVYGPGTTLNQIAVQINELLLSITARRDGLRAEAVEAAKAAGKSPAEAEAAGRAAVAAYEERYGALVAAGLPLGLPSVSNPTFNRTVFFDAEGRTKAQLRWIVPDDRHAAVYVRPREGLDQESTDRLVHAVRAEARQAWVLQQPPPGPTAHRTSVTVTGAPVLVAALGAEVRRELPGLGLVALAAVAVAFLLAHRPGRTHFLRRLAPLVLGLGATAVVLGFFGLRGRPLSLGMLAFLPVMLGVGSDMPIQAAYPANRRILVAATAASAAGFAALVLSPLPFVRDLGLALAAGVLVSTALALVWCGAPAEPVPSTGVRLPEYGGKGTPVATSRPAQATGVRLPEYGGKATPVQGGDPISGSRKVVLAVAGGVAALGWVLLPSIPVEARPERLARGLPALADARRAEAVLGASGEVAVRVRASDVVSPEMLAWFRSSEEAVIAPFGDRLRPVVSPLRLLSWLGPDATSAQIDAALRILPRYLVGASVRSDRQEAVASYGLPLGDLGEQTDLLKRIRAALPAPPAGAEVTITGLPVVASRGYDLLSAGRLTGSLAGPLAAGAVLLALVARRRHALLATAAALLAVGWGALALRVTGVDLTPLTVGIGSLTAAVGCEFTLFTLERRAAGEERAFRGAATAAATAAAGFAALAVSRLDVLAGFGLVLAGSVLLALLAAALLSPAAPPGRPADRGVSEQEAATSAAHV
jgi:predicted RND superfamily exporter protein